MQIKHLTFICFLLFSLPSLASSRIDSVGVENQNNKKVILHKVEPKDNYYVIARKYHVSPKAVIELNGTKSLQIGTIVKVPTNLDFSEESVVADTAPAVTKPASAISKSDKTATKPESQPVKTDNQPADQTNQTALVDYKVGPKETLFAISRKFNTTVDELKSINNLKSNSLSNGQILKVRYGTASDQYTPPTPVKLPHAATHPTDSAVIDSTKNASDRLRMPAKYGLREIDERGIALTIDDPNVDASKMLALHRTAPIGTVVKITNPMTNKSTFAKVVGKFNENDNTKDAIIIVTKAAATLVGALDQRFQVNIVYGVPNEE